MIYSVKLRLSTNKASKLAREMQIAKGRAVMLSFKDENVEVRRGYALKVWVIITLVSGILGFATITTCMVYLCINCYRYQSAKLDYQEAQVEENDTNFATT